MPRAKLNDAETQLINMLRERKAFGLQIMLKADGDEWIVTTTHPPIGSAVVKVGIAPTFEEAWSSRTEISVDLSGLGKAS